MLRRQTVGRMKIYDVIVDVVFVVIFLSYQKEVPYALFDLLRVKVLHVRLFLIVQDLL